MENKGFLKKVFSKEAGKGALIAGAAVVIAAPLTGGISLGIGAIVAAAAAGAVVGGLAGGNKQ